MLRACGTSRAARGISALQALSATSGGAAPLPCPTRTDPRILPDQRNIPTKEYLDYLERRMMKDGRRALVRKHVRHALTLLYARGQDPFRLIVNLYTRFVPFMGVRKGRQAEVPVVLGRRSQVVQITNWLLQHLDTQYEKHKSPWLGGKRTGDHKPAMKDRFPTLLAQALQEFDSQQTLEKKVNELHEKAYQSRRGLSAATKRVKKLRRLQRLKSIVPGRKDV